MRYVRAIEISAVLLLAACGTAPVPVQGPATTATSNAPQSMTTSSPTTARSLPTTGQPAPSDASPSQTFPTTSAPPPTYVPAPTYAPAPSYAPIPVPVPRTSVPVSTTIVDPCPSVRLGLEGQFTSIKPPVSEFDRWDFTLKITVTNYSTFTVKNVAIRLTSNAGTTYPRIYSPIMPHSSWSTSTTISMSSAFGGGQPNPDVDLSIWSFDAENGSRTFVCS
jgi:hypothetical protein